KEDSLCSTDGNNGFPGRILELNGIAALGQSKPFDPESVSFVSRSISPLGCRNCYCVLTFRQVRYFNCTGYKLFRIYSTSKCLLTINPDGHRNTCSRSIACNNHIKR